MARARRTPNIPTDNVYETWINNFSNTEQQQVFEQTQAWAENLRQSTIDSSLSSAWTRSDLMIQQKWLKYERDIHTLVWFLSVLDNLLQDIEDAKSWTSKKWLSKAWKKTMNEAKTKLKQYEKQIKVKKKALLKQDRAEIFDSDIDAARNLRQQINKVRADIWMWQWGEFSNTASYLYNSPENARQSNKHQIDTLQFRQQLAQEVKKWAILTIFNWNAEHATNFLKKIAEWKYDYADYQLFITNAQILTPTLQRCGIPIPVDPRQRQRRYWIETVSWNPCRSTDYSNMDRWDTFQQWWVAWLLDKVLSNFGNMTPWQRETWKSIWVLGCIAWWIYWLYKFYTSDKMSLWWKAWITAWVIFWSQALTWEWPLSLFNKLMNGGLSRNELTNKFGNTISWLSNSNLTWNEAESWTWNESISETIVPSMYSMMIFNSSTKVSDIEQMTQNFKTDTSSTTRKTFYEESCNKLQGKYWQEAVEYFRAQFSDQFDEQKRNNRLAWFWVVLWTTDSRESVYWLANNATMNETILTKFKEDNWLKENWNAQFKEYLRNKKANNEAIDIDDLNAHTNDWFTDNPDATGSNRPEDIKNRENLANKVESLSLDTYLKEKLKQATQDFYDKRSIESKPNLNDFELKIDWNILTVKSQNWNKTDIDLSNNSLKSNNVHFRIDSLSEALNTADLTNYILKLTNNKNPVDLPPFKYQITQKAICFNDATTLSFDSDTRIKNISWFFNRSTTDKNASDYANYLSERRKDINKLNLNSYPLVNMLWIDFYSNEDEVIRLENRLKWVKNKLQYFKKYENTSKPFSIEVITNKLRFKSINWDMEKFPENISKEFPTLSRNWNEEKFLNAMNNPNNKMRWTVFNS